MSHVQELPLSGACIYVLKLHKPAGEEQAVAYSTIEALGGKRARKLSDATHALWVSQEELTHPVEQVLEKCQALKVPVVDASWLERISGLEPHEHWSQINVNSHVPQIVDRLQASKIAMDDQRRSMKQQEEERLSKLLVNGLGFAEEIIATEHQRQAVEQHEEERLSKLLNRRDKSSLLSKSLSETYSSMTQERPQDMEENEVRRAIELSMLDWALVFRKEEKVRDITRHQVSPHDVLGVTKTATPAEIKAAYRRKAIQTHPDKGGKPGEFESIARAYRALLHTKHDEDDKVVHTVKSTAHWDSELQDHRSLVNELFQSHGADLSSNVAKQEAVLSCLGLYAKEAGASNRNERDELIRNSCFYLSLAASYLHGIGALSAGTSNDEGTRAADQALLGETALDLKRTIEAAVVHAHPEWAAQGKVGEEVQAFSDFLVYVLDSNTILSEWAVAVFDTASGFVDMYKGKDYTQNSSEWARSNTLTLRYTPGHYQPLLPHDESQRPTFEALLRSLDDAGVFYVVVDGDS